MEPEFGAVEALGPTGRAMPALALETGSDASSFTDTGVAAGTK